MSDSRLRSLERSAVTGEPGARERLILERIRAGAPDPRVDPTPYAEVEAVGRYNGRYSSRVQRQVVRLWPGRLAVRLLVRTHVGADAWLDRGCLVLSVAPYTRAYPWTIRAKPLPDSPWLDFACSECPEVVCPSARGLPGNTWIDSWAVPEVEAVEWLHPNKTVAQRSTLAAWRKWAKGGTVLWLGGR
jgi:hypothetical protein